MEVLVSAVQVRKFRKHEVNVNSHVIERKVINLEANEHWLELSPPAFSVSCDAGLVRCLESTFSAFVAGGDCW